MQGTVRPTVPLSPFPTTPCTTWYTDEALSPRVGLQEVHPAQLPALDAALRSRRVEVHNAKDREQFFQFQCVASAVARLFPAVGGQSCCESRGARCRYVFNYWYWYSRMETELWW